MDLLILKKNKANTKFSLINDVSIVFIENLLTKALNFIAITILAKELGPSDYGKYSVVYVSVLFLSALLDFGMENTAIRFSSKSRNDRNSIFGFYLLTKIIILLITIVSMTIIQRKLMILINKPELSLFYWYFVLGLLVESLMFVNDTYLQAIQEFKMRAIINVGKFLAILITIITMIKVNKLILTNVFLLYFITLAIILIFIKNYYEFLNSFFINKVDKELIKKIFTYQKWMFILSIINNLLTRIDFFLVSRHETYENIGIYNVAVQLATITLLFPIALNKVLLPKITSIDKSELYPYASKILKIMVVLAIIAMPFILLVKPIIPMVLGSKYISSILVCQILLLSSLVHFVSVPLDQTMYALGKVKYITIGNFSQILLNIILGELLIPIYGIIIAAVNICITRGLYIIYIFIIFKVLEKRDLSAI